MSLEEKHQGGQAWSTTYEEMLKQLGLFSFKREGKGKSLCCLQLPSGVPKRRWTQAPQRCAGAGQKATDKLECRKFGPDVKSVYFVPWKWSNTEREMQTGRGENFTEKVPEQPALICPALIRGWIRQPSEII